MLEFIPKGAIFDIDDTLLDNYPKTHTHGLHEYARLLALREIGRERNIPLLAEIDEAQNKAVIQRAREHSIEGSVWQLFWELGMVQSEEIDRGHVLLQDVATRKHTLYGPILREYGTPLPGAVEFVQAMHDATKGKIAVASGARGEDVQVFLQMSKLTEAFRPEHVVAREDFVRAKPDPEAFETAFQRLCLPDACRSQVLAFEDDPKGVVSAKKAGLYVCAITSRFGEEVFANSPHPPDLIQNSYTAFATIFGLDLPTRNYHHQ